MNRQETKRWLRRYRDMIEEIRRISDESDALRETMDGLRANRITGMPGGACSQSDRVDKIIDRLMVIENDWRNCISSMTEALEDIDGVMDMIEDVRIKQIIGYRYMDGLSWDTVSEKMGYSRQRVFELHNMALSVVSGIVDNEKKRSE